MVGEELKSKVKKVIVRACSLDVDPGDIGDDDPLWGEGSDLDLDSIDSLGMIVALEDEFGVHFDEGKDELKVILLTVCGICRYLEEKWSAS